MAIAASDAIAGMITIVTLTHAQDKRQMEHAILINATRLMIKIAEDAITQMAFAELDALLSVMMIVHQITALEQITIQSAKQDATSQMTSIAKAAEMMMASAA